MRCCAGVLPMSIRRIHRPEFDELMAAACKYMHFIEWRWQAVPAGDPLILGTYAYRHAPATDWKGDVVWFLEDGT